MTAFIKRTIILLFCMTLVSACTPTKKEAVQDTEKAITSVFKNKQKQTNAKTTYFTYNQPANLKISQKGQHNIIFQDKNKNVYILFVNPKENKESQTDYQTIKKQMQPNDVLKSFHVDHHFIYIFVKPSKKDNVELIVSAGGVKMSTRTTLQHMADEAEMMSEVIHSVKVTANKKG